MGGAKNNYRAWAPEEELKLIELRNLGHTDTRTLATLMNQAGFRRTPKQIGGKLKGLDKAEAAEVRREFFLRT
jgi:hypothetical protein